MRPARNATPVPVQLPNEDVVIYAIGDVHGYLDQLMQVEAAIFADGRRSPRRKIVVMLGDYVDRGTRSADVVAHLMADMPDGFERVCLCGNHERMMLRFLEDPYENLAWLDFGGEATMLSYGLDVRRVLHAYGQRPDEVGRIVREAVSAGHIDFLRRLPVLACAGPLTFVHAGIRPGIELARQKEQDLLWIREPFLSEGPQLPITVIHGHTPTERPALKNGRICIDTGVYLTERLTAIRWADGQASLLTTA